MMVPGHFLGILGGGQLGRMTAMAARHMGYRVAVFSDAAGAPAAPVADFTVTGPYEDPGLVADFARRVDVVTLEFENIPVMTLRELEQHHPAHPGSWILEATQDRVAEKTAFAAAGVPTCRFAAVADVATTSWRELDLPPLPVLVKTARGGYDGKGQFRCETEADLDRVWATPELRGRSLIVEAVVPFAKELSVIVARTADGREAVFPVTENQHTDGILHMSIAPAPVPAEVATAAQRLGLAVARHLGLVGLLAVELFMTADSQLLANEMAPRPHNSGHYSLDACETSQFEQHVRAVCGLPLGSTELHRPAVMLNLLGQHMDAVMKRLERLLADPRLKLHLYGKTEARFNRKMGHLCLLGETATEVLDRAGATWQLIEEAANGSA